MLSASDKEIIINSLIPLFDIKKNKIATNTNMDITIILEIIIDAININAVIIEKINTLAGSPNR